jgi:hypothetical protein
MESEVVGWPSVVSDNFVQNERWHFTISEISCEFPQISCTVFYKIITIWLDYHKFCARWFSKMLMGTCKMQRMASALTF